jgi:membrane protein
MSIKQKIFDWQAKFKSLANYLKVDIWKSTKTEGLKGYGLKWVKIAIITAKEFNKDKIVLQSSALTYLSILSIVPLVAMIFGISKGFGIENLIESELDKIFLGQEVVKDAIFGFAKNMLNNTKGNLIVGVSIVVLFFTVMRLLNNIEDVFNNIWGKKTARNLIRKFTDYLAMIVVAPILIILSSGVTIMVENQLRRIAQSVQVEEYVIPLVFFIVKYSPFLLIWLLFTMIYVIMPNTKVKIKSGLIAGVIAGSMFQFLQRGFIDLSFLMSNYGVVYGGLAVLPLFFIFNQLSWTIVFIGGELSFAHQTVDEYIPDQKDIGFSQAEKRKIALLVVHTIVKGFEIGEHPLTKRVLSEQLKIPHRFVSDAVNQLLKAGVLTKSIMSDTSRHVYLPSIDINKIDIQYVARHLDEFGEQIICTHEEAVEVISNALGGMNEEFSNSKSNKLLKDIAI